MDRYNEKIIKGKPGIGKYILFAVSIAVTVLGAIFTIFTPFGIFILMLGILLVVLTKNSINFEYEYIIVNGDIEVAKIIAKKKRKTVLEINVGDIVYMDKAFTNKVEQDVKNKAGITVNDYTSQNKENKDNFYAIYSVENKKDKMTIFEFDDKCVEHMKLYLREKYLPGGYRR